MKIWIWVVVVVVVLVGAYFLLTGSDSTDIVPEEESTTEPTVEVTPSPEGESMPEVETVETGTGNAQ